MKNIYLLCFAFFLFSSLLWNGTVFGQCSGQYIKIDGNLVLADNSASGIRLPYWLGAGQTLADDQNVNSISVMVFAASGTTLSFSKIIAVTSVQTVPADTVWKIESISMKASSDLSLSSSGAHSVTYGYGSGGAYTWTAPSCVYYICADVWGAGGGGGGGYLNSPYYPGGGGGGGAYLHICSAVTPGTSYTITVGEGGAPGIGYSNNGGSNGGNSSITIGGTTYTAGGGTGGSPGTNSSIGTGGAGGTATNATIYTSGATGTTAINSTYTGVYGLGGNGGSGGNGGMGGAGAYSDGANGSNLAGTGHIPGGGGGGGNSGSTGTGGQGADGQVIISW